MKSAVVFLLIVCLAIAKQIHFEEDEIIVNDRMVDHINSLKTTWIASTEQGAISTKTKAQIRKLMGAWKGGKQLERKTYSHLNLDLPTQFDSRTNWPQCATMKMIRDQSACGSCWAFGAVEAISDRYCIFNKVNLTMSAQDMNSCCEASGGCDGGYPSAAWEYWAESGLVTEQCSPYSLPGCDHHIANSTHPCPSQEYDTPPCVEQCTNGQNWNKTLYYGNNTYSVAGEQDIMAEVYQNGPVEVAFDVYEDFLTYKGGVYQYTTGEYVGGHAVKIIGWGVDKGQKYWMIANSWNPDWGLKGYFMMLKGVDECGIEDEADAGIPLPIHSM